MGIQRANVQSTSGRDNLYMLVAAPRGPHRGYVQLVHDRYDHVDRYRNLLEYLADAGYVAFAADLIGHGKSVSAGGRVGSLGKGASTALVNDISVVLQKAISLYPPQIETASIIFKGKTMTIARPTLRCLVGIGFGCALVRTYLLRFKDANAIVLAGDEGFTSPLKKAAELIKHEIKEYDETGVVPSIRELLQAGYLDHLDEGKTHRFSYRTSRPSANREIADDPLCAFDYDLASEKVLLEQASVLTLEQWTRMCPEYLPVYLVSGYGDPVTNYTRECDAILEGFKYAHAVNVFFKYFEHSRHDVLLDREKSKVWKGVLTFVDNVNKQNDQLFARQKEEFGN